MTTDVSIAPYTTEQDKLVLAEIDSLYRTESFWLDRPDPGATGFAEEACKLAVALETLRNHWVGERASRERAERALELLGFKIEDLSHTIDIPDISEDPAPSRISLPPEPLPDLNVPAQFSNDSIPRRDP